jgi:hypothetical protein
VYCRRIRQQRRHISPLTVTVGGLTQGTPRGRPLSEPPKRTRIGKTSSGYHHMWPASRHQGVAPGTAGAIPGEERKHPVVTP